MEFCRYCGAQLANKNVKFCTKCGARLAGKTQQEEESIAMAPAQKDAAPKTIEPLLAGAVAEQKLAQNETPSVPVAAEQAATAAQATVAVAEREPAQDDMSAVKPVAVESTPPKRRKRSLSIVVAVMVFLLVLCVGGYGVLWWFNTPQQTAAKFAEAVRANNMVVLADMVEYNGATASADVLKSLIAALKEEPTLQLVEASLTRSASGGESPEYSAIVLLRQPLIPGISKYKVELLPARLVVTTNLAAELVLDGKLVGASSSADVSAANATEKKHTLPFTTLAPGQHTAKLAYSGIAELETAETQVALLSSTEGAQIELLFEYADITLKIPQGRNVQVRIGNVPLGIATQNGLIAVGAVPVGTKFLVIDADDQTLTAEVIASSKGVQELTVNLPAPTAKASAAMPPMNTSPASGVSSNQRNQVLNMAVAYYRSYLDGINGRSMAYLQYTTEVNRAAATARMNNEANKDMRFRYNKATVDLDTMQWFTTSDGKQGVSFIMGVAFQYAKNGSSNWVGGGNVQEYTMVSSDGVNWVVDQHPLRKDVNLGANVWNG